MSYTDMEIIRWTTPTLDMEIPSDLECDYALVTIKGANVTIEFTVQAADIVDGVFSVTLTQEQTGAFKVGERVLVQCNVMGGGTRLATGEATMVIARNLHDEEI